MIHFVKGNIFDSKAEAFVNAVNTVGVMGKGIAFEFKNRYPKNYSVYKTACANGAFKIGAVLSIKEHDGKIIINFPTKQHWKHVSEYQFIEHGLNALKENIKEQNIKSIALPALGCGLGGLKWNLVKGMIETALVNIDIDIYVYEPQ
jgi:O-acetyl-ADP-ribose deacetylase (regulator of RNase III)